MTFRIKSRKETANVGFCPKTPYFVEKYVAERRDVKKLRGIDNLSENEK